MLNVPAIWNCIIGQKNAEIRQTECYITAYNVGFMIVTLSFYFYLCGLILIPILGLYVIVVIVVVFIYFSM